MGPSTGCAAGGAGATLAASGARDLLDCGEAVAGPVACTCATTGLFSGAEAPREGSARTRRIAPQDATRNGARRAFGIVRREFPRERAERQRSCPAVPGHLDAKQAPRQGAEAPWRDLMDQGWRRRNAR